MKIAEMLTEVDTTGTEPYHNPAQFITSNNHNGMDKGQQQQDDDRSLRNSMNRTNSGHVIAPSIH